MSISHKINQNSLDAIQFNLLRAGVFVVGLTAMSVAGWYLIEGMLHFSGDRSSSYVFIAAGIIFQITESICFISAAAMTSKSMVWRASLFVLGSVLFLFSIVVMTLAQKASLQSSENQADALNSQIEALQAQSKSLDKMIASYQLNAEKQSQSIYANSRELGQDSLNRATELEYKKVALAENLFQLNGQRRQTSSDFFQQIEVITGFPALQTEFYFLTSRSLLLEMCGIVLMAFAAYLKMETKPANIHTQKPIRTKPAANPVTNPVTNSVTNSVTNPVTNPVTNNNQAPKEQSEPALEIPPDDAKEHWATSHIRQLKMKSKPDQ